jgi:hypothetical protein
MPITNEPTRRPWIAPPQADQRPDAAPPTLVDTLNGDPKGLKREDINAALQGALPALSACFSGPNAPTSVGLAFDAEPDGRPSHIKVTGASAAGEQCVSATLAQTKLPTFQGKSVPVQFPLSFYRPPAPPAPAAAAPAAVEQAAAPAPVPVTGATVPPAPPSGMSTAPYAPSTLPATAGSAPSETQVKTFIQP